VSIKTNAPAAEVLNEKDSLRMTKAISASLRFALLCLPMVCSLPITAQTIVGVRVAMEPEGPEYFVDGTKYFQSNQFSWPVGSRHILRIEKKEQYNIVPGARFVFANWTDSAGQIELTDEEISVVASAGNPVFRAIWSKQFAIGVSPICRSGSFCDDNPGTALINNMSLNGEPRLWVNAESTITVQAVPSPGYIFMGWESDRGTIGQQQTQQVVVTQGMTIRPIFARSRAITVDTVPTGMQVIVDGSTVTTPFRANWGMGTAHTFSVPTPQAVWTQYWTFRRWDFAEQSSATYVLPADSFAPLTLMGSFVRAAGVEFQTQPTGLRLNVNGRENWAQYRFVFAVGDTVTYTAPAEQTDAQGRKYLFTGWTHGGEATQSMEMTDEVAQRGQQTFVAQYEKLDRIILESNPTGLALQVNGANCATPCLLDGRRGTSVAISTPAGSPVNDRTRWDFNRWTDGTSELSREFAFRQDAVKIGAEYIVHHRLDVTPEPLNGCVVDMSPATEDRFFVQGQRVDLKLTALPGFRFLRWEGDLSSVQTDEIVRMTQPMELRPVMERVPFIEPNGIRNAAGGPAEAGVAPGSMIAIFGANFTPGNAAAQGGLSPMSQVLDGVTVRMADRLLPLYLVSETLIHALLPEDLPPGTYNLTVRRSGQQDVSADVQLVRNAPGVFTQDIADLPPTVTPALAYRADGSLVTPTRPAKTGELITIIGTGFGPYTRLTPFGFAIPAGVTIPLADTVEVVSGDSVSRAVQASAATGRTGATAIQVRVTDAFLPPGQRAPGFIWSSSLRLRVNGRDSNVINLPIE
jgi:uncharacterized protein (TIGR03437 family)